MAGNLREALAQQQARIEEIVRNGGEFSLDLIEPLIALGRIYRDMGDADSAREALLRAQHITHRNEGVYSARQFEIIEMLVDLEMQSGQPMKADKLHKLLFFVKTHYYEGLDNIPAYLELADWYNETGQYHRARKLLSEAVDRIEEEAGPQDLRLVKPLQMIATSRRLQGMCCAEKSLQKSLDILDHNADSPGDLQSQILNELADAYILSGKPERARTYYERAWNIHPAPDSEPELLAMSRQLNSVRRSELKQMYRPVHDGLGGHTDFRQMSVEEQLLAAYQPPQKFVVPADQARYDIKIRDAMEKISGDPETEKLRGKPFQFVLTQLHNILPISLRDEAAMANLRISLRFTVTDTGRAKNIEIVNSNAPVKLRRLMKEVVSKARFRPALIEGKPVTRDGFQLTQSFPQE